MIQVSLREGVLLAGDGPGSVIAQQGQRRMRLNGLPPDATQLLLRLASEPLSWESFDSAVPVRVRLAERCLVQYACVVAGRELLTAVPASSMASFDFGMAPGARRLRLSRFACLRRTGESFVIESPVRFTRVTIHEPSVAGLLARLSRACPVTGLYRDSALAPAAIEQCARFLLGAGILAVTDPAGALDEDTMPALAQREFHDVMLHVRSRGGLTDQPTGATFPFAGIILPSPAVKGPMSERPIALPKPDIDRLSKEDPPLAEIMERRKSIRHYDQRPITVNQLGEFLYRVARVRSVRSRRDEHPQSYETSDRTYPSGGATYDLEFYLTVRACDGLTAGIYHYDPSGHALSMICQRPELIDGMINHARMSGGWRDAPPVVITLASRFSRLGWKYQGICYAITLKNVGVLYEAMYLVATAMNLAPCALGGGNSDLFSRITGLDPLVESSVGEFMLGTPQDTDTFVEEIK